MADLCLWWTAGPGAPVLHSRGIRLCAQDAHPDGSMYVCLQNCSTRVSLTARIQA